MLYNMYKDKVHWREKVSELFDLILTNATNTNNINTNSQWSFMSPQ